MNTEQFRVTSVRFISSNQVIFMGIPIRKGSYKLNSGKYTVSVKAHPETLPVTPATGQHWKIRGIRSFSKYENNGYEMKQYVFESPTETICTLPQSDEQLVNFITNEKDFKGIGESKARKLWNELGKDFHKIASNDSLESRMRLKKLLSDTAINALFKGYAKYANLSACNWMCNYSIPASIQQRLLKYHNEKSIDAIKANPYVLIGFGMSFKDADKLAIAISGPNSNDHRRLSAALEMTLRKKVADGHTFTTQNELKPALNKLLGDSELVSLAFNAGHIKTQYIINPEKGTYHPTAQLLMEKVVSKRLMELATQNNLYDKQANTAYNIAISELPYELENRQAEAVVTCLKNAVSCITGGAGTGKTTVLRTVLRAYHTMGYEIHAVAVTSNAKMIHFNN